MTFIRFKRSLAVFVWAALLAGAGLPAHSQTVGQTAGQPAAAAPVAVGSPAELTLALRNPRARSIALAPGDYGDVTLGHLGRAMRIAAADPATPPVFSSLTISGAEDLTLADIVVKLSVPPDKKYQSMVNIDHVSRLTLTGMTFDGAAAPAARELRGLLLQNSSDITISDCRFTGFFRALVGLAVRDVMLTHNDISGMSSDGFNFAQAQNVTIARNRFGAFKTTEASHADYVQFWSTGTEKASRNITVAENLMLQGEGVDVQGIFLEFEPRLPARDVTVRDNVIIQSSPHGISLYNVIGATVEGNMAVAIPQAKYKVAIRLIGVSDGRVTDNVATAYGYDSIRNVTRQNNSEVGFADKPGLARIGEAVAAFLDGRPLPPLLRIRLPEAIRAAGVRPHR